MYLHPCIVSKLLQLIFLQPHTAPVASPAVTVDVYPLGIRECVPPCRLPPAQDAFTGKLRRIMVCPQVHEPGVIVQHIYPIKCNLSQFREREVMVQHFPWILFFPVFRAVVFEISDIFLLFGVNRDHRLPLAKELLCFPVDKFKLVIAVRVRDASLQVLLVALPAVAHLPQELPYFGMADVYAIIRSL